MKFKNLLLFGLVFMFLISSVSAGFEYWRQDDNTSKVWIKGNFSTGVTRIYWDTASGTYAQNPKQVFPFFDNFSGVALNTTKWTVTNDVPNSITYAVSSGNLVVTGTTYASKELLLTGDTSFGNNYAIFSRNKVNWGLTNMLISYGFQSYFNAYGTYTNDYVTITDETSGAGNNMLLANYNTVTQTVSSAINSPIDYYIHEITRNSSKTTYIRNNTNLANLTTGLTTTAHPVKLAFASVNTGGTGSVMAYFDWIFVKKHIPIEPSISCNQVGNYCDVTVSSSSITNYQIELNVGDSGNLNLYSSVPSSLLTAIDIYTNSSISSFSADINGEIFYTNTGTLTTNITLINKTLFNITFFNSSYINRTYTNYNFSASGNLEGELLFENQTDRIRFLDATNSSGISGATVTVTYPLGDIVTRTTNSTGHINFSIIKNNAFEEGVYQFEFNKAGYTLLNFNEIINFTTIPIDETYSISRTNIKVNIYDRTTGDLLNKSVELYFLTLFNDTTSTGLYNISNVSIIAGTYTIQALSTGYGTEQKTFIYTAQENITINFYLLNLSNPNAGTLFINTLDEYNRRKTNVNVILSEYSPTELSYIDISYCKSNANGECVFNVELNTKTYIVRGYILEGSNLFTAQLPEEILSVDNEVRNLVLFLDTSYIYSPEDFLIYNIDETYSNITNTSIIIIDFYKTNNLVSEMCLEYFRQYVGNLTSLTGNTYCLNSTSAIQYINGPVFILNTNNTYIARVTIDNILLDEFIYPANNTIEKILQDRSYISFIVLLIWIVALGFSLHTKILLFGVFAIALSWIELALFPTYMILEFSAYKTIISVFILWASRKKKESE